jgi:hypothetical protein
MVDWFSENGLILNTEKKNVAKFTSHYCYNAHFQITYQNKERTGANKIKFLGSELHINIKWISPVYNILPKTSRACYLVRVMYPIVIQLLLK